MTTQPKTKVGILRQGDVMLRPVAKIPDGLVKASRDQVGRVVLAHGERTGHAHAIRAKHVTGFKRESSEYDAMEGFNEFILVGGSGAALKHELVSGVPAEHDPVRLAPGNYEVLVPVEHTDEDEPRLVMD